MSAPLRLTAVGTDQTVRITYDQPLDEDNPPLVSDYSIALGGGGLTEISVVVLGAEVFVGTSERFWPGLLAITTFVAGRLRNLAGELAPGISGQVITNATTATDTAAPVLLAARVNGGNAYLYFNEILDPASVPVAAVFAFTINGVAVAAAGLVSIYGNRVTIQLATAANAGDFVTLTYTLPGSGRLRDYAPNDVAAIGFPIVLENLTTTVVGHYADKSDVEDIYGIDNVAQWSQLDNNVAAADDARIKRMLDYVDAWIDFELDAGGYVTPIVSTSTSFVLLKEIAARMAGVKLYSPRGMLDEGTDPDGKMKENRVRAEEELEELIGSGRIDGVLLAGTDAVGGGIQTVLPADTLCGGLAIYPGGGFL